MPTTLEALFILFIFAVPAYLTITVFKARYPILYYRAKQSTLAEATLYAFLGALVIIFTISFLALLGLLVIPIRNLLPAGAVPTLNMADDPAGKLLTIAVPLIIAYYATGVTFSFLIGDIVPHILPKEPPPLWFKANTRE